MGCTHCLVDAKPHGAHITLETYLKTLDFALDLGDPFVMLSGGEPTEHPSIAALTSEAVRLFHRVAILSNGMWLHNPDRTALLLATGADWQITNDPRFYPRRLPAELPRHPKVCYEDHVTTLVPLGRYTGPSNRKGPACFNLRSATRHLGSFASAVGFLRWQAKNFCTPSIDPDGTIRAGEAPACFALGTVWSTEAELTEATLAHDCNRCGLHEKLPAKMLKAVANG